MKDRAQAQEFVEKIFDDLDVDHSGKVDCLGNINVLASTPF